MAFLYQFFRKKSYKEELEKAKKLLEENLISQEEFEIINKNISTAK
ncbi:SHOCT domain-containing protein [Fusobacterium ulcerans]